MKLRILTSIVVLLALMLMLPATSGATRIDPDSIQGAVPQEIVPAASPTWDDGGAWEVGAEAAGGSLYPYAISEATYLSNRLGACGWNQRYIYGSGNAWEEDFKKSSLGGTEQNYLDTVDLQFYVGHGSTGGFTFDPPLHDDSTVTPADCNRAWGDGDNEWVALTSCQVLSDPNLSNWAACFNGGHLILGFVTNASANTGTATTGYRFADYLCNAWTVTSAWFKACDVTQPAGRKVRVLANELACYDDKPGASSVCADSYDTDAWYWDHTCGSETPSQVDVTALGGTMPVFKTQPLSLAEAQRTAGNLGTVFQMPPPAPPPAAAYFLPEGDEWRSEANNRELQLDRQTGIYTYYDLNQLWKAPTQAALAASVQTISADDARTIADNFLRQNNLMPGDARFYEVVSDNLGTLTAGAASTLPDHSAETPTVWQVVYSRYVSATFTAAGLQTTQDFLVIGPGAKEKVYVSTQGVLAASGSAASVLGNQGGWPKLQQPLAAGVDTVPILPEAQIRSLYNLLESKVVLNTAPIDADSRVIISSTVNYWSNGFGQTQSELIPVYSLNVRYSKGGTVLTTDWAYVPANPTYIPPFARIDTAPTDQVHAGQQVRLVAADATKTLAQLGVDPSLTFTLGNGDYKYDWYVDSVAEANRIGGGRTIDYTVRPQYAIRDGVLRQQIILKVTDLASSDQRSATDTVTVTMDARHLTLPLILMK